MELSHTMVRVNSLEESLPFYTEFLGLTEVRRKEVPGDCTLVFLKDDQSDYYLELTYNHDGREYELGNQFGHLAFFVDDLAAVIADVEERGWWYRGSRPEMKSRYIFVKDPNGYDIEILEKRR